MQPLDRAGVHDHRQVVSRRRLRRPRQLRHARARRARPLGHDPRHRRRVPVATRAAATCCAASSGAPCATPTCSAPTTLVMPRSSRPPSTSWAMPTPTSSSTATSSSTSSTKEEERFRQTLKHRPRASSTASCESRPRAELSRRRRRSCCTTPTASRSSSPRRSPASAASTVDLDGFDAEMAAQREPGQGRPEGRTATAPTSTPTATSSSSSGPPSSSGYRRRDRGRVLAVVPVDRRRRSTPATGRDLPRPHPVLRRVAAARSATPARSPPRPARAEVLDTTFALPGLVATVLGIDRGHDHGRARRATAAIDVERRAAIRRNHTAHPPAALGAAPGARRPREAGRARSSAPTASASTSATTRPSPTTRSARSRPRQRRDARQPAGPRLRDHQGRSRGTSAPSRSSATSTATSSGCSRRARRSSSAAAPTCAHRRHRHRQDRQRGLDRLEPAPHRGGHRWATVALLQRDEQLLADAARLVGVAADELVDGVQRSSTR